MEDSSALFPRFQIGILAERLAPDADSAIQALEGIEDRQIGPLWGVELNAS